MNTPINQTASLTNGNIDASLARSPAHVGNKEGGCWVACREDREQLQKKRAAQQMVAALLQLHCGASAAELRERLQPIHLTLDSRICTKKATRPGPRKKAARPRRHVVRSQHDAGELESNTAPGWKSPEVKQKAPYRMWLTA